VHIDFRPSFADRGAPIAALRAGNGPSVEEGDQVLRVLVTLGYSPVATGVAFLPTIAMIMVFSQLSNIVLMPRIGPKPLVGIGMLIAAAGMAWLTRIGVHSGYASTVLGPLLVSGAGIGLSMPASMNTGTFGVAPDDAGVASATLNVGQQLGGSIGTSLLNTIATSAAVSYLAVGGIVCGSLLRRGPLAGQAQAAPAVVKAPQHERAPSARP